MEKLDLKKELKEFYRASNKKISLIKVPKMNYLMIDGFGHPEKSEEFQKSFMPLYGTAYTLKFAKKEENQDFTIMPLECLWWADDPSAFDSKKPKYDEWQWTLMILVPDFIKKADFNKAVKAFKEKKNLEGLEKLRFEKFGSGTALQMMHIGPYDQVGNTIEVLGLKLDEMKRTMVGKHHEIYLSDPRRTAPEKLKTIVKMSYK